MPAVRQDAVSSPRNDAVPGAGSAGTGGAGPGGHEINIFSRNEVEPILRALRQVARANHRFTDAERALMEGVARIHEVTLGADDLQPISLDEGARAITAPPRRKRAVQLAIVMALVEGTPPPAAEAAVRELA